MGTLYRAEYSCYTDGNISICINSYTIIKQTNKGVWIQYHPSKKFVLLTGVKRFAYPTTELTQFRSDSLSFPSLKYIQ